MFEQEVEVPSDVCQLRGGKAQQPARVRGIFGLAQYKAVSSRGVGEKESKEERLLEKSAPGLSHKFATHVVSPCFFEVCFKGVYGFPYLFRLRAVLRKPEPLDDFSVLTVEEGVHDVDLVSFISQALHFGAQPFVDESLFFGARARHPCQ